MRPLGIYLIGISIYILNMIHFMMISGDFSVFSLMLTDGHTDPRRDGRTDIWTDRSSYIDARTHLKTLQLAISCCGWRWVLLLLLTQFRCIWGWRRRKGKSSSCKRDLPRILPSPRKPRNQDLCPRILKVIKKQKRT